MSANWKSAPLRDLCEFHNGLWAGKKPPYETAHVIRNTNFTAEGRIDLSDVAVLQVERAQLAKRRLRNGDIIVEKSGGGPKQPVGRVVLFDLGAQEFSFSNFTSVIRSSNPETLDPTYLHRVLYWWYVSGITEPLQRRSTGIRNLDFDSYKNLEVPLPQLDEQKRIVTMLDQAFAALDRARANAEANLADAESLFDSWLTAVFHEHPTSWRIEKLHRLCRQITVGHVGPMAERYSDSGVPFLRSQNVRPFQIVLDEVKFIDETFHSELSKSALAPGDVAIVRTGYPGTAAVVPESLPVSNCADLVIVRPGGSISSEFLAMFLNSTFGKQMVAGKTVGAAQKHFNVGAAKEVDFPFPDLAQQQQLVSRAFELRMLGKSVEQSCREKLADIAALRQSLLQAAFSAQLS